MRPAEHFNEVTGFVGQNSQNTEPLYNATYNYVILTLHSFVHMINKWWHTTAHKSERSGVAAAMIVQTDKHFSLQYIYQYTGIYTYQHL